MSHPIHSLQSPFQPTDAAGVCTGELPMLSVERRFNWTWPRLSAFRPATLLPLARRLLATDASGHSATGGEPSKPSVTAPTWSPETRRPGALAFKRGMMSFWDAWGVRHPVTVLHVRSRRDDTFTIRVCSWTTCRPWTRSKWASRSCRMSESATRAPVRHTRRSCASLVVVACRQSCAPAAFPSRRTRLSRREPSFTLRISFRDSLLTCRGHRTSVTSCALQPSPSL